MPADVKESSQLVVAAANDHNRLAGNLSADVSANLSKLIYSRGYLPRAGERCLQFKILEILVGVPGGRNRERFLDRRVGIVGI